MGGSARAERDARHYAFLADATEILWSSLEYEDMLARLARLSVPTLGDLCIVDVVEPAGVRRVASVHALEAKAPALEELRRRYPPTAESMQPAGYVLRTGQPHLLRVVDQEVVLRHAATPEHRALIHAIGIRSHVAVPIASRGTLLGVMSLGITESDRQYGEDDIARALDVARRAALAIENARLYAAAQQELAERRRTESALRLSELRFRAVVEQAPLSTQIFDPSGFTVQVNRAWERLWGSSLDRIRDYNILADRQLDERGVGALIRRAFAGEAVAIPPIRYDPNETLPNRTDHADPVRWVRAFAYPVKDEEGTVVEVVLVHEDVTSQERAEGALRRSEERLRLALSGARMNVWDWDLETNQVQCSDNAVEFWGRSIGDAEEFLAVIHPEDLAEVRHASEHAIASGTEYRSEFRLVGPDGTRWVESRGRVDRDGAGRAVRILGVTIDIGEIKAAETAVKLLADAGQALGSSLDYHATLDQLARIVVPRLADWCVADLVNDEGELERVAVNHPDPNKVALAREVFERYRPRRHAGHGIWHVIETGAPQWAAVITDETLQAAAMDAEHLALLRGLNLRSYVSVPLRVLDRVIGVLTLVYAESGRSYGPKDIELALELGRRAAAAVENARLYQQLRTEDRRKDEFLATLAHELRNPLAPIRTGLELLGVAPDVQAGVRARDIMKRQVEHMVRLIDDLLDLSRVTRGKIELHKERVDLWTVIGAALETNRPLIDAAGHELEVHVSSEPLVLDADRTRLAQVIGNLLNNAAKYTERGGRIRLSATADGGEAVIKVSDSGIGIPRPMLNQIFEMFAQVGRSLERSHGGLGIGLTLVRRLVELHGGRVWAESEGLGRGSTFVVRLPIADALPPHRESQVASAPVRGGASRRVLIVDDNVDAAEMLAALLALANHEVAVATDGPAALAMAEEQPPDVFFLDIGLPGMTGYDLARRIRSRAKLRAAVVVAVTGWGQAEDKRRSTEAGFDHHLTKPVDPREVLELVEHAPRVTDSANE